MLLKVNIISIQLLITRIIDNNIRNNIIVEDEFYDKLIYIDKHYKGEYLQLSFDEYRIFNELYLQVIDYIEERKNNDK